MNRIKNTSVRLCEPSVVLCETKKITQSYTEKTLRTTEKNNLGNPENLIKIMVQTSSK